MIRDYLRDHQHRPIRPHPEAPREQWRGDADHVADLARAIEQHRAGAMSLDHLARRALAFAMLVGSADATLGLAAEVLAARADELAIGQARALWRRLDALTEGGDRVPQCHTERPHHAK